MPLPGGAKLNPSLGRIQFDMANLEARIEQWSWQRTPCLREKRESVVRTKKRKHKLNEADHFQSGSQQIKDDPPDMGAEWVIVYRNPIIKDPNKGRQIRLISDMAAK